MNEENYDPDDILSGAWELLTKNEAYKALKNAGFDKNGPTFSLGGLTADEYFQKLQDKFPLSRAGRIESLKMHHQHCLRWRKKIFDDIGNDYPEDFRSIDSLIEKIESELRFYGCGPHEWNVAEKHETEETHSTVGPISILDPEAMKCEYNKLVQVHGFTELFPEKISFLEQFTGAINRPAPLWEISSEPRLRALFIHWINGNFIAGEISYVQGEDGCRRNPELKKDTTEMINRRFRLYQNRSNNAFREKETMWRTLCEIQKPQRTYGDILKRSTRNARKHTRKQV